MTVLYGATLSTSGTPGSTISSRRIIANGHINQVVSSSEVITSISPSSFGSVTVKGITFSSISISTSNTSSYSVYAYASGTFDSSTGSSSATVGTITATTSAGNTLTATIYARVTVNDPTYTYHAYLYYNANGGSGAPSTQSTSTTSSSSTPSGSASFTISSTKPSKSGYTFLGWSESSSATSASYQPGSTISVPYDSSKTLYAVWKSNSTFTSELKFNANGGSGAPSTLRYEGTSTSPHIFTIPSTVPIKSGFVFLGWSTSSTATSASYQPGDTISVSYNGFRTLYAVWEKEPSLDLRIRSGDTWTSASKMMIKISDAWKIAETAFIKVNGEWVDCGNDADSTENNWDLSNMSAVW